MVLVSPTTLRSPVETEFAADLQRLRPELADPYRAALPAARAAVLARLWRGLRLDPLPRVIARQQDGTATVDRPPLDRIRWPAHRQRDCLRQSSGSLVEPHPRGR